MSSFLCTRTGVPSGGSVGGDPGQLLGHSGGEGRVTCVQLNIAIAAKITFTGRGLALSYRDFHTMVKQGIFLQKRP